MFIRKLFPPSSRRFFCQEKSKASVILNGTASSPGFYKGQAVIVKDPHRDAHRVTEGCVLVCSVAFDGTWNDIISMSGALVTQIGGKVSHGPMVCRRLGIPCVSGVEDLWDYVSDDDTVIVRGNSGSIEILNKQQKPKPKKEADKIFTQAEIQDMISKDSFDQLPADWHSEKKE